MNKPLSDVAIKKMRSGDSKADVGENSGLRVTRSKTGITRFWYRYRSPLNNQLREYTVGYYPHISLAEARVLLRGLKAKRLAGTCIATEAKVQKTQLKEEQRSRLICDRQSQVTVRVVIERYLMDYIEDKFAPGGKLIRNGARQPKGQREVSNLLMGSRRRRSDQKANKPMLVDLIGDIAMEDLTHRQVIDAIQTIYDRGANVSAGNVLREFTSAVDFSIGDLLPDDHVNPCHQAKSTFKRKKLALSSTPRKRVLTDAELRKLLNWLPISRYSYAQQQALKLALMTGCRTGEIVSAQWADISFKDQFWHLQDTKTGIERYVQLSRQALDLLQQLRSIDLSVEYVFPRQDGATHIEQKRFTESAWHMRLKGVFLAIDPWTPHDLRRTVRTGLARLQCPFEIGEAILGHAKKGIEGTYNLHRYDQEAKVWLQKWNDHLDCLYEKEDDQSTSRIVT